MATGSLINLRSISNKPGYTFNAGSIYNIFAEDYLPIKDALQTAGSEVLIKIVNLTTVERDNQVSTGSVTGSGIVVYNTTVGSLQFYDGTWHDLTDNYLVQGVLPVGSIPNLSASYSVVSHNHTGSYLPMGVLPVGSIPALDYLPHGVLPVGSIPVLGYIPQGQLITGSLPNTINISGSVIASYGSFSGQLLSANLSGNNTGDQTLASLNGLPQGILPVGSIPSLSGTYSLITHNHTGSYLPQGQLPTGSLPNNIVIIGSISAGSISGTNGSFTSTLVASNLSGNNTGDQTLVSLGGLPQGVLPIGSIPSLSSTYSVITHNHTGSYLPLGVLPIGSIPDLSGNYSVINHDHNGSYLPQGVIPVGSIPSLSYLPQGQLPTGSLPNNITVSGSVSAGSFIGYGGSLTGLPSGVTDHGALTGLSDDDHAQYLLNDGSRSGSNLLIVGSVIADRLVLPGDTSGTMTLRSAAAAGTVTVTVPATTGTVYVSSGTDVSVGDGGTGRSSHTARMPILGGTTSTDAQQSVAATGTAGMFLTYNGTDTNPSWSSNLGSNNLSLTGSIITTGSINANNGSFTNFVKAPVVATNNIWSISSTLELGTGGSLNIYNDNLSFMSSDGQTTIGSLLSNGSLIIAGRLHSAGVVSTGSINSSFNSVSGNSVVSGSYYGYGATLTNVLPQGQLPTGSLPNNITVTGSIVSAYGSYTGNVVAGSYFGYGGALTGISAVGGGLTWNEVTGTSQSAIVDNGYITNNAGLVTITLPATSAVGKVVRVAGQGAGGWAIAQNAGQNVRFVSKTTTSGTGGSLVSTNRYDAVELLCVVANNTFNVISSVGNIGVG